MTRQYRSEAAAPAPEAALGLPEAGVLSKRTMRKFDAICRGPVAAMVGGRVARQAAGGLLVVPGPQPAPFVMDGCSQWQEASVQGTGPLAPLCATRSGDASGRRAPKPPSRSEWDRGAAIRIPAATGGRTR